MDTSLLSDWACAEHSADGFTFDVYRKGSGPGVVIIPEVPGPSPAVIGFCEEVVAAGYRVALPHLFGTIGKGGNLARGETLAKLCVRSEFTKLALGVTTPVAEWLRSLARDLHAECGGPGVGALGMCFTGGFALAMMVDESVAAPVLCQPSVPFAIGKKRSADLNLAPHDLERVKQRAEGGCAVLGLRFTGDPLVGTRFRTLERELGENFIAVEFPGVKHSTVTDDRQQEGVDAVLDFFAERLTS